MRRSRVWTLPVRKPWWHRPRLTVEQLEDRNLLDGGIAGFIDLSGLTLDPSAYAEDRVLVRYEPGFSPEQTPHPWITSYSALPLVDGLYEIALSPEMAIGDALAIFQGQPGVSYAEPDHVIQLSVTPNDTSYGSLWGMNNTGQSGGTVDADIDAPRSLEPHHRQRELHRRGD